LMFKINESILLKKMFFGNRYVNFILFCLETKEPDAQFFGKPDWISLKIYVRILPTQSEPFAAARSLADCFPSPDAKSFP
jgi:hypothetical protein